jgi:hypothetical protein
MKTKNTKNDIYPELIFNSLKREIYSLYLQGVSVEDICSRIIFDERSDEGGEWEGVNFSLDEVDKIIDHCLTISGV